MGYKPTMRKIRQRPKRRAQTIMLETDVTGTEKKKDFKKGRRVMERKKKKRRDREREGWKVEIIFTSAEEM